MTELNEEMTTLDINNQQTLLKKLTIEINHEFHGLFNMPIRGTYPPIRKSYLKVLSYCQRNINLST